MTAGRRCSFAYQLRAALWPERDAPRGTFNNVVSLARRHLGTDNHGQPLLPRRAGGRYRLGDVGCDLAAIEQALVKFGGADEVSDDILRAAVDALGTIRGRPFEGWTGAEWPFDEALVARAEAVVAAVSHHLVEVAVAAGRPDIARVAVACGLKAVADPLLEDDLARLTRKDPPRQLAVEEEEG